MNYGRDFYYGINNQGKYTYNNEGNKNNNSGIINDDLYNIDLLKKSLTAQRIGLISNLIGQIATIEAITRVYNKYRDIEIQTLDPNDLVVYSLYLAILAGVMGLRISLIRYNDLCELYKKGELDYSLRPNVDINIANFLGVLSNSYGLLGALGVRARGFQGPIF